MDFGISYKENNGAKIKVLDFHGYVVMNWVGDVDGMRSTCIYMF